MKDHIDDLAEMVVRAKRQVAFNEAIATVTMWASVLAFAAFGMPWLIRWTFLYWHWVMTIG